MKSIKQPFVISWIAVFTSVILIAVAISTFLFSRYTKHDQYKAGLSLPQDIDGSGSYTFLNEEYVVSQHSIPDIKLSEIPTNSPIICYFDASSSWTIIRDFLRLIYSIDRHVIFITCEYSNDVPFGRASVVHIKVRSFNGEAPDGKFNYRLFSDSSVVDLLTGERFDTILDFWTKYPLFLEGSDDVTVEEYVTAYALYSTRYYDTQIFVNIK